MTDWFARSVVNVKSSLCPKLLKWVSMERLCCPFLKLQLSGSGNQTDSLLTLTGSIGVKEPNRSYAKRPRRREFL